MKVFLRQIYSYNFHICKFNKLKIINDLYSQCLTQTMSKTSSFTNTEGVLLYGGVDSLPPPPAETLVSKPS